MKKLIYGLGTILLATTGAVATTSASSFETNVWFRNDAGQAEQTTVSFTCVAGDPTCIGTHGPSLNKQLYADQALTIELEQQ